LSSRRTNREEKIDQSLLYPGTEVFINKLDIRNPKWLEQAELVFYMERMRQPLPKATQELTYKDILLSITICFRTYTHGQDKRENIQQAVEQLPLLYLNT